MDLNAYLSSKNASPAAEFARRLGVPPALISQWRTNTRPVPIERCVAIERLTDGLVSRRDLRPQDWCEIWPELVGHHAVDEINVEAR
jgi:DNA-binding transcriptional regulator YdaS (Cro superfamily)